MAPNMRHKRQKRGVALSNEKKAVIIADAVRGVPLREIAANHGPSKSTIGDIVKRAKKRKQGEIEALGLVVREEDKENWTAFDLIEPQYLQSKSKSGQPRVLSTNDIATLIQCATSSKAQRYKPWPQIAADAGYDHVSDKTIYNAFHAAGYIRAKAKKKPALTDQHKINRKRVADQLLYSLRTGPDIILAVDECKATSGLVGSRMVTRTVDEVWEEDTTEPAFDKRTGLMFFGIIGRNFKGKFYVFDPEDTKEKQRIKDEWEAEVKPQLDVLLIDYEDKLERYETAKARKAAASPADARKIKTGRKPIRPTMKLFPYRGEQVKGIDWYRYLNEVIDPILAPEIDRFIENKDP